MRGIIQLYTCWVLYSPNIDERYYSALDHLGLILYSAFLDYMHLLASRKMSPWNDDTVNTILFSFKKENELTPVLYLHTVSIHVLDNLDPKPVSSYTVHTYLASVRYFVPFPTQ